MSLRPETKPIQGHPDGHVMMNASMVIELAKRVRTPQGDAFLSHYHEAEARIAGESPFLSENAIRNEATLAAYRAMGLNVVLNRTDEA